MHALIALRRATQLIPRALAYTVPTLVVPVRRSLFPAPQPQIASVLLAPREHSNQAVLPAIIAQTALTPVTSASNSSVVQMARSSVRLMGVLLILVASLMIIVIPARPTLSRTTPAVAARLAQLALVNG